MSATTANDLEPMYKKDEEDKQDEQSIGAWYSHYKGIESHVQLCNTLMLTYRIDYNEYTGGAHGIYMSTFPQPRPKDPKPHPPGRPL